MNTTPEALPVRSSERIAALDVLRGFALWGVFLVNFAYTQGPSSVTPGERFYALELWASVLLSGLFETKFVTLFSLLFGMGLVLQMGRGKDRGVPMTRRYLRRLGLLCATGLVHGCLLFEGDILFVYSLAGFVLLACHAMPLRRLLLLGLSFLAIGLVLSLFWSAYGTSGLGPDPDSAQAMTEGPLWFTLLHRAKSFAFVQVVFLLSSFDWRVLAMFFFGALLMRSKALDAEQRSLQGRVACWGVGLGVLLESYAQWVMSAGWSAPVGLASPSTPLSTLAHEFGSLGLGFGLGASVVWCVNTGRCPRLCAWLGALGRMALSHYLLQSVLMNVVLVWFGFGLWGELSRLQGMGLVCVLFWLQLVLSVLWSRCFAYGPAEWLWRWGTYGRRPELLRQD